MKGGGAKKGMMKVLAYLDEVVQVGEVFESAQACHVQLEELELLELLEEGLVFITDLLNVLLVEDQLGYLLTVLQVIRGSRCVTRERKERWPTATLNQSSNGV